MKMEILNINALTQAEIFFKYKNSDGEINKDIEAKKLIKYIVNGGIKVKSVEIAREW